jgi:hypothetical protein
MATRFLDRELIGEFISGAEMRKLNAQYFRDWTNNAQGNYNEAGWKCRTTLNEAGKTIEVKTCERMISPVGP